MLLSSLAKPTFDRPELFANVLVLNKRIETLRYNELTENPW